MPDCPACNGHGYFEEPIGYYGYEGIYKREKCYTCDGEGEVTQQKYKEIKKANRREILNNFLIALFSIPLGFLFIYYIFWGFIQLLKKLIYD